MVKPLQEIIALIFMKNQGWERSLIPGNGPNPMLLQNLSEIKSLQLGEHEEQNITVEEFKKELLLHRKEFALEGSRRKKWKDMSRMRRALQRKIRIFCWILTGKQNHEKRAQHIKATWVKRCNKYLFMSSQEDDSLPAHNLNVSEGREFLWLKTREAFKYIYDHYLHDYDWFLKADDDTYVIVENLRYLLLPFSPDEPLHFGHKFNLDKARKTGYHSGGAGYVLSREALRRFGRAFNKEKTCGTKGKTVEDLEMGKCLETIGVRIGDSRDQEGFNRFNPLNPDSMTSGAYPKWIHTKSYYTISPSRWCCSPYTVSFHYLRPALLYMMEYLVYRVKVFGVQQKFRLNKNESILKAAYESAIKAKGPDQG
ncbi:hypothetical protein RB195_008812 [Necator americanus]|uniref:N-acetylgalactosaminide beta-1,3-galactosyltransferase n=1 Tax=Necator americanus TaxID=51031 RepID=A0ABR1CQG6_NECAM